MLHRVFLCARQGSWLGVWGDTVGGRHVSLERIALPGIPAGRPANIGGYMRYKCENALFFCGLRRISLGGSGYLRCWGCTQPYAPRYNSPYLSTNPAFIHRLISALRRPYSCRRVSILAWKAACLFWNSAKVRKSFKIAVTRS